MKGCPKRKGGKPHQYYMGLCSFCGGSQKEIRKNQIRKIK